MRQFLLMLLSTECGENDGGYWPGLTVLVPILSTRERDHDPKSGSPNASGEDDPPNSRHNRGSAAN